MANKLQWKWVTELKATTDFGLHFEIEETEDGHEYLLYKNGDLIMFCYSFGEVTEAAEGFKN